MEGILENFDFNSSKMTGNAFINSKLNIYIQISVQCCCYRICKLTITKLKLP